MTIDPTVSLTTPALVAGVLIGYLSGSIPFAYLITRRATGKDLRIEGTKNIGTVNAFDVTGKRSIGISVLIADVLKGLLPVVLFEILGFHSALLVLLPSLILGHCYPVWLRFHGGRGLATAAGALLPIDPVMIAVWLAIYWLARRIYDDVHFGAIAASSLSLLVIFLLPLSYLSRSIFVFSGLSQSPAGFGLSVILMLLVILSRHIEPFRLLLRKRMTEHSEPPED